MQVLARAPAGKHPCLLPVHPEGTKNAVRFVDSNSLFYGLFFVDEVRAAVAMGYKVETYGGYRFDRISGAFDSFVDELHGLRRSQAQAAKSVGALATKLIINGLYGRLAMKPTNQDYPVPLFAVAEKLVGGPTTIIKGGRLVQRPTPQNQPQKAISLPVSAAVTAYARVAMSRYINWPNITLLYSDTDSVFFTTELPMGEVTSAKDARLGTLKFEGRLAQLGIYQDQ